MDERKAHGGSVVASSLLMTLLALGCGDNDQVPTYSAKGTVLYEDDGPVADASVLFGSVEHGLTARGRTSADGTFVLGTYDEADGAVAGEHDVAIVPNPPEDFDPDAGPAPKTVHPRFQSMDTSEIRVHVEQDGPNDFKIEVHRRRHHRHSIDERK